MAPPPNRLPGSSTGVLLAVLNVLVISLGMAVASHESAVGVFVFMFTIIPAVLAGLILGCVADSTASFARATRIAVLAVPSLAVLALLAGLFNLLVYVPLAGIPTVVAVILLEAQTRKKDEFPIPIASARTSRATRSPQST